MKRPQIKSRANKTKSWKLKIEISKWWNFPWKQKSWWCLQLLLSDNYLIFGFIWMPHEPDGTIMTTFEKITKKIADHPSIRNIIKEKFKTANKFSFRPANKDIVWYCKKVANKSSSKWRIKVLEENIFFSVFSKLHQWRCYQLWVPWPLKIN